MYVSCVADVESARFFFLHLLRAHYPRPSWLLTALFALVTFLALLAHAAAPFRDNNDGTVSDESTGLMWDQCVLDMSTNPRVCDTGTQQVYSSRRR